MKIEEYISSGIIELYVMGLCSEDEKREIESLRRQYPELEIAIRDFETELEAKMQQNTSLPAAETDKRILKSLDELRFSVDNFKTTAKKTQIIRMKPLMAAAVLLLIVCGYFIYSLNKKITSLEKQISGKDAEFSTLPAKDYKIMLEPTITPVAMLGVGIHSICRCTMFWDKKTGKIYIIIHHLPQPSSTKDYQLWAMVNGKPVSVGIIQDEIRGRFIEMKEIPSDATEFIVTLEKAGGNESPTMEETYMSGRI